MSAPWDQVGVPPTHLHQPSSPSSSLLGLHLTFTQGFILGQVSIVILALVIVRYILFEDAQTALRKSDEQRRRKAARLLAQRGANGAAAVASASSTAHGPSSSSSSAKKQDKRGSKKDGIAAITAAILATTGYDLGTHPSETADWLNVVFALALAGYRDDILSGGHATSWIRPKPQAHVGIDGRPTQGDRVEESVKRTAKGWLEEILNASTVGKGMDFLDPIIVNECHFGDEYPFFSNVRIRPADDSGRIRVEVDVDYSDAIVLAIETKLIVNFPKPRFAILPVSLGLTVERFSGTLHISLHPDFSLEAHATSLLGSKAKLQDIPKIEQLLVARLRGWVHERFVWPRFWVLTLPNLVPVPGGGREEEEEGEPNSTGGGGGAAKDARRGGSNAHAAGEAARGGQARQQQQQQQQQTMTDEERFMAQQIAARASGALGPDDDLFFDRGVASAPAAVRSGGFGTGGVDGANGAGVGGSRTAAGAAGGGAGLMVDASLDGPAGRIPGGLPSSVEAWRYEAASLGAPGVAVAAPLASSPSSRNLGGSGGQVKGGAGTGTGTATSVMGLPEAQLRHRPSYQGFSHQSQARR